MDNNQTTRLNGRIDKVEDKEELHWNTITKSLATINTNIALLQMRDEQLLENSEKICEKIDSMYNRINKKIDKKIKYQRKLCKKDENTTKPIEYLTNNPIKGGVLTATIIYVLVMIIRDLIALL